MFSAPTMILHTCLWNEIGFKSPGCRKGLLGLKAWAPEPDIVSTLVPNVDQMDAHGHKMYDSAGHTGPLDGPANPRRPMGSAIAVRQSGNEQRQFLNSNLDWSMQGSKWCRAEASIDVGDGGWPRATHGFLGRMRTWLSHMDGWHPRVQCGPAMKSTSWWFRTG